jgi:hypothetical protein
MVQRSAYFIRNVLSAVSSKVGASGAAGIALIYALIRGSR